MARSTNADTDFTILTVKDLQSLCADRGLPVSGNKDELLQRLAQSIERDISTQGPGASHRAKRAKPAKPAKKSVGGSKHSNPWVDFCARTRARMRAHGKSVSVAELSRMYKQGP
jgi:hypothetical protein